MKYISYEILREDFTYIYMYLEIQHWISDEERNAFWNIYWMHI